MTKEKYILKIFSISDIHADFEENRRWLDNLSLFDYQNDFLILAGDITDLIPLFKKTLTNLRKRFKEVFFVPGNHDLWVLRDRNPIMKNSLEKLDLIHTIATDCGVHMKPFYSSSVVIVPLFSWYDYSFGQASPEILKTWADFVACKWPNNYNEISITKYFIDMNQPTISDIRERAEKPFVISYSHFLPRLDLMPSYIPYSKRILYPVLGTSLLEQQIRLLDSRIHIYGHSHVNNQVVKDNTLYVNNAFGYPYEKEIAEKKLKYIFEN